MDKTIIAEWILVAILGLLLIKLGFEISQFRVWIVAAEKTIGLIYMTMGAIITSIAALLLMNYVEFPKPDKTETELEERSKYFGAGEHDFRKVAMENEVV